jgi:hypothetical protein
MTMKFSTETLMAYADGTIDGATRADIEAEIPHDPALSEAVTAHIEHRAALQAKEGAAAFAAAATEDVPSPMLETPGIEELPKTGIESARPEFTELHRWSSLHWSVPHWGAIVLALVIGVIVGRLIPASNDTPFVEEKGRVLARGPLDSALSEQSGGRINRETGIQIGVSYLAKNGDYCRTFTLRDEQVLAGLACRRDAQWTIDALTRTKADASSAYRMAGASVPALILGLVEDTIAGDPLDAEQEVEAQERNWER